MAKRTTASKPARQLGELLQEQQEPFILEVYLSERGCVRKNLSSGANFIGCHGNSGKLLKEFGSQNQSKKGISSFPKLLKVVLSNKFFTIKGLRTQNSHNEDGKLSVTEMDRNNPETAEPDRFSSASSTTVYNSCSDSDMDESSTFAGNFKSNLKLFDEREKKAAADAKYQWSCMEDSKQHSPPSVLEEISTSISKWVLQQTKQLLFDCVRELAENNHEKEDKEKEFVGSELQIGNVICKKMKRREKRYGDESNIRELLESDVMDFEKEKSEIGLVIGNAIVEEITSEVVMDMVMMIDVM